MTFVTKLRALKPFRREFVRAIRQIFSAEDSKREHLLRRELRPKTFVEIFADDLCPKIDIASLHQIVDLYANRFHRAALPVTNTL